MPVPHLVRKWIKPPQIYLQTRGETLYVGSIKLKFKSLILLIFLQTLPEMI